MSRIERKAQRKKKNEGGGEIEQVLDESKQLPLGLANYEHGRERRLKLIRTCIDVDGNYIFSTFQAVLRVIHDDIMGKYGSKERGVSCHGGFYCSYESFRWQDVIGSLLSRQLECCA